MLEFKEANFAVDHHSEVQTHYAELYHLFFHDDDEE